MAEPQESHALRSDCLASPLESFPDDFKCPIEVMGEVMQKAMAMRHDAPASIQ